MAIGIKIMTIFFFSFLGFLSNSYSFPLFFISDFTLGKTFIFLILYLFGAPWALLSIFLVNAPTFLSTFPHVPWILFLEILVLAWLKKRKNENLVILDGVYWIIVGIPIFGIIHYSFLSSAEVWTIFLERVSGSLLNAWIATCIIDFFPLKDWILRKRTRKTISLNTTIFHSFLACVLLPVLVISISGFFKEASTLIVLGKKPFVLLLTLISFSILYAYWICKKLMEPLKSLIEMTDSLPRKIFNGEEVSWPKSVFTEINFLINNIKETARILGNNFEELTISKEQMEQLIYYHPLTHLPNRSLLERTLDKIIQESGCDHKEEKCFSLMFLDIDNFKIINDTVGNSVADHILQQFSKSIEEVLQDYGELFHLMADEFVVLQPNVSRAEEAANLAKRIKEAIEKQHFYGGEFRLTVTIGIVLYPRDGYNSTMLLQNADLAMQKGKERGKNNFQFYNVDMNQQIFRKMQLVKGLRKALDQGEFQLYYQPQIDSKEGAIKGVEALLRWNSTELGCVSPEEFIPLAEETGLILPIGYWVMKTACAQNKRWQDKGYPFMTVSVNISAFQFQQSNFLEEVKRVLEETGLDSKWLILEITEGVAVRDMTMTNQLLNRLKNLGIKIALDDFGTGFSSLGYLRQLEIDTLKIASPLINGIDHADDPITKTIVLLGQNLKLEVIAEGVETESQFLFLRAIGCHKIQGYFFSRPLPPDMLEKMLKKERLVSFGS